MRLSKRTIYLLTLLMMTLLLTCGALFGCARKGYAPKHKLSDITAVSISCASMNREYSYSFFAHISGDTWLFYAECFAEGNETEVSISNHILDRSEVNELFCILESNNSLAYAEAHKKAKHRLNVSDGEAYSFSLKFLDGVICTADGRQAELEQLFYRIADAAVAE